MNKAGRQSAIEHALRDYPKEACGLFVRIEGSVVYYPCKNIADSDAHFTLDPQDYADADELGEVVAVFHSHPDALPAASDADVQACEASGLPWYIVSVPNLEWAYTEPKGFTPDLVGRDFVHGKSDCFTLVRDYYRKEHNLILNDYERDDKWWEAGKNLYLTNFQNEGFVEIPLSDLQPGDALFIKLRSPVPNHAAIYLGYNTILHHLYGRLSCREIYSDFWRKVTTHALRYKHEEN